MKMKRIAFALLAIGAVSSPAAATNDPRQVVDLPAGYQPQMIVTTTAVLDGAGVPIPGAPSSNTLVWALRNTGDPAEGWKGRRILLKAGSYPSFSFDSTGINSPSKVHRLGGLVSDPVIVR